MTRVLMDSPRSRGPGGRPVPQECWPEVEGSGPWRGARTAGGPGERLVCR